MSRQTPRPVYLPNTPKFIFGTDSTELVLSLPSTLWDYAVQSTGGSIEGDSGMRAAFVIRRDELITFTLRFFESEWSAIQRFIDHVQDGQPFTWIPDQLDQTTIYDVQLVHPAVGEKYEAAPNPDYPLVQLLTLTVMKGAVNHLLTSGAFIRPDIVYIQGDESSGQMNRVVVDKTGTFMYGRSGINYVLTDGMQEGTYEWHSSGGRDGAAYVTTVANTVVNHDGESGGQYTFISLPPGREAQASAGMQRAFNLFGRTLTEPINIMAMAQDTGSGKFFPACFVSIMTDRTIQVRRFGYTNISGTIVNVGPASTFSVPASGWFALEWQRAAALGQFDEAGYTTGATLVQYYDDSTPPQGIEAIKALNVDTGRSFCFGWAWGSETTRIGHGFTGLGMDDGVCYMNAAIGVKRFIGESFVVKYAPTGPGTPIAHADIQSRIGWDSGNVVTGRDPATGDLYDFPVGGSYTHGVEDRWKNVVGDVALSDDDFLLQRNVEGKIGFDEFISFSFSMGSITPATHTWDPGPYWPPYNQNQSSSEGAPFGQPWDESEESRFVRNTFASYTDTLGQRFLAREMYALGTTRSGIKAVEGIQQYARFGVRWLNAIVEGGSILSGAGVYLNIVSEHSFRVPDELGLGDTLRHSMKLYARIDGLLSTLPVIAVTNSDPPYPHWRTLNGTTETKFIALNPNTEKAFTPVELNDLEVGATNDFTSFDQAVDAFPSRIVPPTSRWSQFDLAEEGYEALIHKRTVLQREHAPFPPNAWAIQGSGFGTDTDLTIGRVFFLDASTDWDGYIQETTIDWGDGSPIETLFEHGVAAVFKRHDYAHPGTYPVIVHTEDNDGLADDVTYQITVPAPQPIAAFHPDTDLSDVNGLTIDFTDLSVTPVSPFGTNEIVSWHWNFGDGHESSLQNPSHTFATADTYPVSLTVANDLGETNTLEIDLDVPLAGANSCAEFSIVPPPAFVQGDDLLGTNVPYIAYPNKASFLTYYYNDIFTGYYSSPFGIESNLDLDFVETFNDHPSIVMYFGAPTAEGYSYSTGAGWDSDPSDDGYPDEQFYEAPPWGPLTCWARTRFKTVVGVMSDPRVISTSDGNGLEVFAISGRPYIDYCIRGGKLYADFYADFRSSSPDIKNVLICDESLFTGLAVGTFFELGVFFALRGDPDVGYDCRVITWTGEACSMSGVAFAHDTGWLGDGFGGDEGIDYLERYNWFFGPDATIDPPKKLWHGSASQWFDFSFESNPYGYSLAGITL